MGWAIGIALVVVGLIKSDSVMIVAAGLFALTGAVSAVAVSLGKSGESEKE